MSSFEKKALGNGLITITSQAYKLIAQTLATAILARILFPEDFGIMAMVISLSGMAMMLKDLGLSTAVVQAQKLTHEQVNTIFWINFFLGLLLFLLFYYSSHFISILLNNSEVERVTKLISTLFIIDGIGTLHFALLKRDLRFKLISAIDIISTTLSLIVTVLLALYGAGYWALVVQPLLFSLSTTSLGWCNSGWKPTYPRFEQSAIDFLKFGSSVTVFNITNYLIKNIDNALIGRYLGATQLGYYSKAYNLLLLPIRQISNPINSVALPMLSRLINDPQKFDQVFMNICLSTSLVTMPIIVFSYIDADLIVDILLGDKWLSTVETFRYLAPAAIVSALSFLPSVLCVSTGNTNLQLKWIMYSAPLIIIGFIFGLKSGINGVAISFSITYSLSFLIFVYISVGILTIGRQQVFNVLFLPLLLSFVSGAPLILTKKYTDLANSNLFITLIIDFFIFVFPYIALTMMNKSSRRLLVLVINAIFKKGLKKSHH